MLGRTKERVAEKRIGSELHEGFDHLRSAATLAAGRAAERIGPAVDSARASTKEVMAPRVEHAREAASRAWESRIRRSAEVTSKRAKNAEKLSRRARRSAQKASVDANRLGRRVAIMRRRTPEPATPSRSRWVMGAVGVGAALGAVGAMISKRRAPEWQEYEPMEPASGTIGEKVTDMAEAARRKTGTVMETEPGETDTGISETTGRHTAGEPKPESPPATGPTVEPSSMQSPDARPPGI